MGYTSDKSLWINLKTGLIEVCIPFEMQVLDCISDLGLLVNQNGPGNSVRASMNLNERKLSNAHGNF